MIRSAGLGGSVWSNDKQAAAKIAEQMECGTVWINKHGAIQPNAPFGGIKSSGLGVEFGVEGCVSKHNDPMHLLIIGNYKRYWLINN